MLGMFVVIAVLIAEAHEWAEAHWAIPRRPFVVAAAAGVALPKVSIHVPAYNEPPQMLIETLDALARLDYPDYEVIVVDNNTQDEAVWRPVEQHCRELGARFRFFHVDPLPGFKAGALNFALARMRAGRADRRRHRQRLPGRARTGCATSCRAFAEPNVAIVQAPQDYRDGGESAFKAMCYAEYRGFFQIGMVTRNERNAIIQHGTMTLVRRQALEQRRRLGGMVHHRRRGARTAFVRARLRGAVPAAQLRPRPDARDLHRLQEAALPLGLRRGADSSQHMRAHCSRIPTQRLTRGPALSLHRRLAAVARRRTEPGVQIARSAGRSR